MMGGSGGVRDPHGSGPALMVLSDDSGFQTADFSSRRRQGDPLWAFQSSFEPTEVRIFANFLPAAPLRMTDIIIYDIVFLNVCTILTAFSCS